MHFMVSNIFTMCVLP